jgi:uncharacterized protein YceK
MDFPVFRLLLLVAVVMLQVGCATSSETTDESTPALEQPSTSHEDDSHGWGTNLQRQQ